MYPALPSFQYPSGSSSAAVASTSQGPPGPGQGYPSNAQSFRPPQPAGYQAAPVGPPPAAYASPQDVLSHSEASSTLRIKIADEFKIAPPIPLPSVMEHDTAHVAAINYELEKEVLQDDTDFVAASVRKQEELLKKDGRASKYIGMGHSSTAVSLAVAYAAATKSSGDAAVIDFCNNLNQLTAMGFSTGVAAGALALAKNDMQAATDALLQ